LVTRFCNLSDTVSIIRISRKSIAIAVIAVLGFSALLVIVYYLTYGAFPDGQLVRFYLVLVALLGGIPVLLHLYRFGLSFVAGASLGWLVNCLLTAARDPLRPSMEAGIYNLFIIILGVVVGAVLEVRYQARRRQTGPR
jgi:hypothetical protein